MGNESIVVSFSDDSISGGSIMLEQEPYDSNAGVTTMLDIVKALSGVLVSQSVDAIDCGMNDGGDSFNTFVYAYPSPDDLLYDHGITNGSALSYGRSFPTKVEVLKFSFSANSTLKYPVRRITKYEWLSDTYDKTGVIVTPPVVTIRGSTIYLSKLVYGSLSVTYTTVQDKYSLKITARSTEEQNVFTSAFYTWFNGGIEILEVSAPDNAEENYANNVDCSGISTFGGNLDGSLVEVIDGDEGADEVYADPVYVEIRTDYCTGEVL